MSYLSQEESLSCNMQSMKSQGENLPHFSHADLQISEIEKREEKLNFSATWNLQK